MKKKFFIVMLLFISFLLMGEPVFALVEMDPSGLTIINSSGGNTYTRKVATAIGIYAKNGVVPGVHKYNGTYSGVNYHVLEVDVTDTNGTFLQVDYAGYNSSDNNPKYLNNFYDGELTANDEYYWVGAINAGFFTTSTTSNQYGYPTGAVKKNGNWLTYSPTDKSYTWDTTPSYGSGFVTAYFNKNQEFKLIYNGWKDGVFYKYAFDPNPNTWDYGEHVNYSEGVSGAYTLMVDGDSTIHWGKGDYTGTDFWNYPGTAVTLFGQKADGNYLLVTTEGTLKASQQVELMTNLGCINGIRFDGGGSTQMVYDAGLTLNHFYFGKANREIPQGSTLDTSDIHFELYMEDDSYHPAKAVDVPQAEYLIYDSSGILVEDISKAAIGDYWLKVKMNGLEQMISIKVVEALNEHTVTFDYDNTCLPIEVKVEDGGTVQQPENPTKEGYTFLEWQLNGETYDFSTKVTQDITLKAIYEITALDLEEMSGYKVKGEYIELPNGITSDSLSLGLSNIYHTKIYDIRGEQKLIQTLATSDTIQIFLNDILIDQYVVIVKGDITGDGNINVADVGKLYQYLKNKINMDECYVLAGDIILDEEIKITDVGKLYQFIKGKISSLEG